MVYAALNQPTLLEAGVQRRTFGLIRAVFIGHILFLSPTNTVTVSSAFVVNKK